MHAESLVASQEVVDGPDRFGDDERSVGRIVESDFLPETAVDDGERTDSGIREFVTEAGDCGIDVLGYAIEELGEVDGDAMTPRDGSGVAFVPIQRDDDAGHVAELGEQVVDPRSVDRIDHPDLAVDREGVASTLHSFVRMGEPADAALEAVDLSEVGCTLVDTKGHTIVYERSNDKIPSQGGNRPAATRRWASRRWDSTVGRQSFFSADTSVELYRMPALIPDIVATVVALTLAQQLEQTISFGIFVLGAALATLSALAWRRERDQRMAVVAVGYLMFAIYGFVVFLEYYLLPYLSMRTVELLEHSVAALILVGLLAFFVALTRD